MSEEYRQREEAENATIGSAIGGSNATATSNSNSANTVFGRILGSGNTLGEMS